jgi:NADH-quinone oxidoreductase subunit J
MFLNIKEEDLPKEPNKYKLIALGAVIMIPLNILILKAVSKLPAKDLTISNTDFGQIKPIGLELYNNWIIAFELISILLLVALIGSVVLAKKRKSKINNKGEQL